jgi:hypothetical protein
MLLLQGLPNASQSSSSAHKTPTRFIWRWDKAELSAFYEASQIQINSCRPPDFDLNICGDDCCEVRHIDTIDEYYNSLLAALKTTAMQSVV